ncbi:hypothetical protein Moror_4268 [Moniliophthora roreri MCA 2997]|uniref:Uncharacterized protein n=2 Tax=Moniliophthora roreri TaxID=221103 RepID=V2WUM1_MONRO|nr:hypothetical protein Moror_4268 [Moniliophthora roreri MCA 2997]
MSQNLANEKKAAIHISVADVVIEVMNQGVHHKRTSFESASNPDPNSSSPTLFMSPAALSGPGQTSIIDLVLLPPESTAVHPHKSTEAVSDSEQKPRERRPSTSTVRFSAPSASQESLVLEENISTSSPGKETKTFSDIIRHSSSSMYDAVHDAFQSVLGTEKKSIGKLVGASATTFTAQAVSSSNTRSGMGSLGVKDS